MTVKIPDPTFYFFESLVPTWLASDVAYIESLKEYLRSMMRLQDYEVLQITHFEYTPETPLPIGTTLVRVEAAVREFDLEVG